MDLQHTKKQRNLCLIIMSLKVCMHYHVENKLLLHLAGHSLIMLLDTVSVVRDSIRFWGLESIHIVV